MSPLPRLHHHDIPVLMFNYSVTELLKHVEALQVPLLLVHMCKMFHAIEPLFVHFSGN